MSQRPSDEANTAPSHARKPPTSGPKAATSSSENSIGSPWGKLSRARVIASIFARTPLEPVAMRHVEPRDRCGMRDGGDVLALRAVPRLADLVRVPARLDHRSAQV